MAATGFTPISTYYTTTASAVPTAGNLVNGELALNINTADGKLFYKDSAGVVQVLATRASASGSFTNLSYTGTLTGGTGVVNLGSGQFYKDASGNIGVGTASPATKLQVQDGAITAGAGGFVLYGKNSSSFPSSGSGYFALATNNVDGTSGGMSVLCSSAGTLTERMRISSAGNVGVGTSNPLTKFVISDGSNRNIEFGYTSGAAANYFESIDRTGAGSALDFLYSAAAHRFYTGGAERMRIDSSGRLLVGLSSSIGSVVAKLQVSNGGTGIAIGSWDGPAIGNYVSGDSSGTLQFTFGRDNVTTGDFVFAYNGALRASISAATGVYTPLSDIRVKKNIEPLQYGLNEILKLKPVIYNMVAENDDDKKHIGLIAQEVKSVIDEAVSDLKDEKTQMYGLATSELVPVLIKAIQELKAEIDLLKGK